MKEKIEQLKTRFETELAQAAGSEDIEKLRIAYLGKKGGVTDLLKGLKDVSGQQKKELGQEINRLKTYVVQKLHLLQGKSVDSPTQGLAKGLFGAEAHGGALGGEPPGLQLRPLFFAEHPLHKVGLFQRPGHPGDLDEISSDQKHPDAPVPAGKASEPV